MFYTKLLFSIIMMSTSSVMDSCPFVYHHQGPVLFNRYIIPRLSLIYVKKEDGGGGGERGNLKMTPS